MHFIVFLAVIFYYLFLLSKPPIIFDIEGNKILSEEYITQNLSLSIDQSFFEIDSFSLALQLKKLPWIEKVRVIKRPPDTLRIVIKERLPIAFFKTKKQKFYIDEHQVLLKFFPDKNWQLPTIVNDEIDKVFVEGDKIVYFALKKAIELINILKTNKTLPLDAIDKIYINNALNLRLVTKKNQIEIAIGFEDYENKLATLHFSMPQLKKLENKIQSIDLRYFNKLILKKKERK